MGMDQRFRTDFSYNLQLLQYVKCDNDWLQMPIIKAKGEKPSSVYTGFRKNLKMHNIQSFSYTKGGESLDVSKILKK